ncbi:MAG: toll/interleukin-1 receptor domain-containing protein [Bacteroidia bacterium]
MIFEKGHFRSSRLQKSWINESLNKTKTFSSRTAYDTKTTVFLSYKHKDLEELEEATGVIEFLEDLGVKIYIDSMDNKMPEQTSGDTAKRIKEIIKYCNKFILLATEKAIESYWCNWELGIGDVHKYPNEIAVLPIKNRGQLDYQYKGNEYLQIYPNIDYFKAFTNREGHFFKEGYYHKSLKGNDGRFYLTPLQDWLSK